MFHTYAFPNLLIYVVIINTLRNTSICICLFPEIKIRNMELLWLLCIYLDVELLDHMGVLFLIFLEISVLFLKLEHTIRITFRSCKYTDGWDTHLPTKSFWFSRFGVRPKQWFQWFSWWSWYSYTQKFTNKFWDRETSEYKWRKKEKEKHPYTHEEK